MTITETRMQLSDDVIFGGIIAAVSGFVVWLLRLAAHSTMSQFTETMRLHAASISANTKELSELRHEITEQRIAMNDFNSRLKVVENNQWDDGK